MRPRYYNNPDTRAFMEELHRERPWYMHAFFGLLGILVVLVLLTARCFGWRPSDDE